MGSSTLLAVFQCEVKHVPWHRYNTFGRVSDSRKCPHREQRITVGPQRYNTFGRVSDSRKCPHREQRITVGPQRYNTFGRVSDSHKCPHREQRTTVGPHAQHFARMHAILSEPKPRGEQNTARLRYGRMLKFGRARRSQCVENSLWQRLWTCRGTDCGMNGCRSKNMCLTGELKFVCFSVSVLVVSSACKVAMRHMMHLWQGIPLSSRS